MSSFAVRVVRAAVAVVVGCGALALSGCQGFFVYPGSTTTGTGSTTGSYVYVSNSTSSANSINGYALSGETLTATTASPYALDYSPLAMTITPANTFLYAASNTGSLYGYSIGTGGALTILGGGAALVTESATALDVSPDGKWLFVLDLNGTTISQYSIASTGAVTFATSYAVQGAANGSVTPSAIRVAPSGEYFAVTLGTAGMNTFAFNTSTGAGTYAATITPGSAAVGIYGLTMDAKNNLYAVGTAGLQVFSVTSAGVPTLLNTYATGNGAHAVTLNAAGTYAYVANTSDSTISAYTVSASTALTPMGAAIPAPTSVQAIAHDTTGSYVVAAGLNATTGTQLYSVTASGLSVLASAGTLASSTLPTVIAITH